MARAKQTRDGVAEAVGLTVGSVVPFVWARRRRSGRGSRGCGIRQGDADQDNRVCRRAAHEASRRVSFWRRRPLLVSAWGLGGTMSVWKSGLFVCLTPFAEEKGAHGISAPVRPC